MPSQVEHEKPNNKMLVVDGLEEPIVLRAHPLARQMSLRISPYRREAILTIPVRGKIEDANQFVNKNLDWLKSRLSEIAEPVPFSPGSLIPFRGEPHELLFSGHSGRDGIVTIRAGQPHPLLQVSGAPEHAPRRLRDWLKNQARRSLDVQVIRHAQALGLRPRRLTVRDQISRWGSCSSTGTLSFSWRLILAPPEILDYVAAHEVAHLKEMNHSDRFWRVVAKIYPNFNEARDWLRECGPELHRYGNDN